VISMAKYLAGHALPYSIRSLSSAMNSANQRRNDFDALEIIASIVYLRQQTGNAC